jgi:type IV pilus assembly protein PilC
MEYEYLGSTEDNRIVKGKLSASSEEAATDMLAYSGYRVLSLKEVTPFLQAEKLIARFSSINPAEVIMFSRQLALLLEAGTDVVTSLELLQAQVANRSLKKILADVVDDVRGGNPLSKALSKHPRAFSTIYHQLVAVGERTGNLEVVLRRAAGYMERTLTTQKSVKNALVYPTILFVVAIGVVGVMLGFVFPAFTNLYASFNVELPAATRMLIGISAWVQHYGLWLLLVVVALLAVGFIYTKTPAGRYQWGKLMLTLPRIGRINLLNELARCCRSIALLFGSGLPLPDIMTLVIHGSNNKAMQVALTEVQESMIAGGGLSGPMRRSRLFLPLMVQMTAVGEETGNLDNTLTTVAESYEVEADDKTKAMIALITPALTLIVAGIVGFIALSLVSAMYSIYGAVNI